MENESKRRICCFCETWESGGIESFLYNVLSRMDFSKIEVDIVASELRKSIFTPELQKKGIQFYELSGSQRNVLKNWRNFQNLLVKRKYDVVHLNIFQGLSLYYACLAKRAGVPVRIAHSHNTALRKSKTKPLKLALHQISKNMFAGFATDFWACSKLAAEFMFPKQLLSKKGFQFIPNGIDTERFRFNPEIREKIRAELGITNAFVIGNVGRLCYQKNQTFLLQVFAEVLQKRPESRLLLVGTGELESSLKRQAKELGIMDKVIFYGASNHVEQLLWAMDLFVFPSLFEGLGIVVIEAQSAGLPVICSKFVPQEVNVTPLVQSLPLEIKVWRDKLLRIQEVMKRKMFSEKMEKAGFDIWSVMGLISKIYNDMM